MDNMLELLVTSGMDFYQAIRLIMPPSWQNMEDMDSDLRSFYTYNSLHMEAWDGPAGVVLTDGRYAVCVLDKNGLRPSRWVMTKDGCITAASEIGVNAYNPEDVVATGRQNPAFGGCGQLPQRPPALFKMDQGQNQFCGIDARRRNAGPAAALDGRVRSAHEDVPGHL
jgi:hypothetical protein